MVVFSYLILMMAVMLWVLRIVAAITTTLGTDFPLAVFNMTVEIILLFSTFFCFLFILRRRIIGALVYMFSYIGYFGTYLYTTITTGGITPDDYINVLVSIFCIIIPILIFLDIGLNRNQKNFNLHKKTDWFYNNKDFDRKFDDRADRNQYKF